MVFFRYNDNLVSPIPQMKLASNLTMPIITPEEASSVTYNLTISPVTSNAILIGSNKNTNIETFSSSICRSALSNINSSKKNFLKVETQLSALESYVNCELSIQRNQMESFTEQTKMLLGHENSNINTLHKNIAFLQNELTEKNQILKFLMETQTAGLDVMKDLIKTTNEYSRTEDSGTSITN